MADGDGTGEGRGGPGVLGAAGRAAELVGLVRLAPASAGGVRILGVDGRSGSGKTDLASAITGVAPCPVVRLDDLYAGWRGLAASVPVLCAEVVRPLLAGRPGRYRRYDWHAGQLGGTVTIDPAELIVIEGVGALAGDCAEDYALRVWLEAPTTVRRRRALARDSGAFAEHWHEWAEQEEALFADGRARGRADVLLDTSGRR